MALRRALSGHFAFFTRSPCGTENQVTWVTGCLWYALKNKLINVCAWFVLVINLLISYFPSMERAGDTLLWPTLLSIGFALLPCGSRVEKAAKRAKKYRLFMLLPSSIWQRGVWAHKEGKTVLTGGLKLDYCVTWPHVREPWRAAKAVCSRPNKR